MIKSIEIIINNNKVAALTEHGNNFIEYEKQFADAGMIISGRSPDGRLPEIVELKNHPFFIAGQFHPEFQSSPYTGHPMFNAFIAAAKKRKS